LSGSEARTHSAVHVLKGALIDVLAVGPTASVRVSGSGGRLTVTFERKPTGEELKLVEQRANAKVAENAELAEFEMDREEAEGHFGRTIYDLFPIPEGVRRLRLVRIPDWEINCCAEKHVGSTSEIGRMKIVGARFRNSKKLLEIEFLVIADAVPAGPQSAK
jgi:alanyl-tRNA synthetase